MTTISDELKLHRAKALATVARRVQQDMILADAIEHAKTVEEINALLAGNKKRRPVAKRRVVQRPIQLAFDFENVTNAEITATPSGEVAEPIASTDSVNWTSSVPAVERVPALAQIEVGGISGTYVSEDNDPSRSHHDVSGAGGALPNCWRRRKQSTRDHFPPNPNSSLEDGGARPRRTRQVWPEPVDVLIKHLVSALRSEGHDLRHGHEVPAFYGGRRLHRFTSSRGPPLPLSRGRDPPASGQVTGPQI